jgi:hypothetical protein
VLFLFTYLKLSTCDEINEAIVVVSDLHNSLGHSEGEVTASGESIGR